MAGAVVCPGHYIVATDRSQSVCIFLHSLPRLQWANGGCRARLSAEDLVELRGGDRVGAQSG